MKVSREIKPRSTALAARSEQRREEILEAAIRLFAQNGYADTDLQELADILKVGKGTVYRSFGSKQELFLAAADLVMLKLRRHLDTRIEGIEDPLERIIQAIHAYLEYFDTYPEAVEMLIQERAQFKGPKRPTYFVHREANVQRWRDIYRDLIAEGRIRPLPVERISDTLGDLLYGTMFVNYIAGRHLKPSEVAENIVDVVFHGILTDGERGVRCRRKLGQGHKS